MSWHTRIVHYIDAEDDRKYHYFLEKSSTLSVYHNKLTDMRNNASYAPNPPTSGYVYGDFATLYYDKSAQFTEKLNDTIGKYDSFIDDLNRCASRASSLADHYEQSRHRTRTERYWVDDDD